ncbi:NADH-quinone oxidoreductase subunit NuoN [Achromobacter sp. GG226]|uniref:NADH-quinone oxidoreductase subunit NuoN n=1 Tax=Verticiella alkaliphila TaxID=2779529 RepID=UPI001C0B7022|nr:NADH-quinone oxidoreductase subunit NuoN [Verticiella sp. GG226]MBU4611224.1 NADH-quinone oxidoreductase subunit NuoN [Verticiella sp. GG226]
MQDINLNFALAAPEILLLVAACGILVVDAFARSANRAITYGLTQLTFAVLIVVSAMQWSNGVAGATFHGLYVADGFSHVLKIFTYLAGMVTLVYGRAYAEARDMVSRGGELYVLALLSTLGQMVMISAGSMVTIFLGLELMSLALYALVALRRDHTQATEAAMKYFVLGALATGFLLYGMSMLYGATGSLSIAGVAAALAQGVPADRELVLVFGLVFIVSGLAFKLGVVPFHMWVPDVYHGAPTPVTLLLGAAPKLATFAITVRILGEALPMLAPHWQSMMAVLAVLSLLVGNLAAIMQTSFKRMLAYSTIAQMGFILLGLMSGTDAASRHEAFGMAMFYVVTYVMTTLGTFGVILLLSRANGFEADNLDDLKGLNRRSPWFALLLLIMMFSLAGLPPTVGFQAKLVVLSVLVDSGYYWLAVAAVLLSLIGAFYYLRVVKFAYFDEPTTADAAAPIEAGGVSRGVLSANGLLTVVLGVVPGPLMALCLAAVVSIF